MTVDNGTENQRHSCPKDFAKPMQLVMDDHGTQSDSHRRHSGKRVSTKSKAPSPPILKGLDAPDLSQRYPGYPHLTMDQKENLIEKDLSLIVVLPGGAEKMTTVHGSKPLMDLLVMLCAKYHLNPSSHTLELVTTNRNNIKFKPNALIGTLQAEKILLKPKGLEEKGKKTGPQMPEATVRMVINYKKTQKTILRVNPRVPLQELLPAICEKCEFDVATTVLLRDVRSQGTLDLSHTLNDYAIREVYARDTKADRPLTPVSPVSPTRTDTITPGKDKCQKEKENKGMFSKFRKSKKKHEQATTASAPASPVLVSKPRPLSMALPSSTSPFMSTTVPVDVPKKRRAPQPPVKSCPSDLATRQRINSAPENLSNNDQVSGGGMSRGSSAESSLKRTKRKAPPPPTSPSVVVQDTASLDGHSQGEAATITLEEIREQEETTASVISGTVSDKQGDESNLNLSVSVSLDYPSIDGEMLSSPPTEGTGEDPCCDLSSDGKPLQSTVNDSAEDNDPKPATEMDSSDLGNTESSPVQVEEISQQRMCEEYETENPKDECSCIHSGSPGLTDKSETQEAETEASVQADTETPGDDSDRLERPVATSTPRPPGEDAQVQTDFPPLPVPSQQQEDEEEPSSATPARSDPEGQKMATFTGELSPPDLESASSHTSDASPCQTLTPSASAITKPAPCYAADLEPKPKPSNELTRDYIPKVGMTTYTIVPQKSLEKLRYFEVALTLEAPPSASEEEKAIGSLQLEDSTVQNEDPEVSMQQTELQSTSPKEDPAVSNSTATAPSTVNNSVTEPASPSSTPTSLPASEDKISSPTNGEFQVGSPVEVKEMKIPPATKPKPGSFRLAMHKKTPGDYVTSAAVKSHSASPVAGQREAPGSLERGKLPPPPLPPPLQCQEKTVGGTPVELSLKEVDKRSVPVMQLTRQSSLSSQEQTLGLSLEKLRSFAAPKPYSPVTPSRFAQAVSSAVKRSQSLSHGPRSPASTVSPSFSPITGRFGSNESGGLSNSKESDSRQVESDKSSTLQEKVEEPSTPSGTVETGGENPPFLCLNHCDNQSTDLSTDGPTLLPSSLQESTI